MNYTNAKVLLMICSLNLFLLAPGFGQDIKESRELRNKDKTSFRIEGFYTSGMGGESNPFKFDIISFRMITDMSGQPASGQFVLFYQLLDPAEPVKIEVGETQTRYFMIPQEAMKKNGRVNYFAWDADYAAAHNVQLAKLNCVLNLPAKTMWDDFTLVPAGFSQALTLPQKITGYQFVFYSYNYNVNISVVIKDPNRKVVLNENKPNCPKDKEAVFLWKPLAAAAEGKYSIVIDAQSASGEARKTKKMTYYFFHKAIVDK